MFRKRRSSKKLDIQLHAKFRENHPDVRPGTSAPIHLSVTEAECIIKSGRKGEADAQQGDTTVTPPSGVSWLSSGDIETPLTTDEYAPRRTTVAQRPKAEEGSQRTVVGSSETLSPTSEHDVWSDYILPEYLFPSETIQFGNSQDFSCILTPQKSCQGTLSSASPDVQPLSLLAREAVAGLDFMDVVEPHHFEIMDTVFQENGNTESALPVLPSNSARFRHRLDAPPALMSKGSGEIPMTYLNKGSHYSILVEDTLRARSLPGKKVYRTSVQVVFDTEQQRQQPLAYWQLWEQNRDDDEARSFKGRSLAIEYVGPHESDHQDHVGNLQIVHSDGFSLIWSADHSDMKQFSFTVRLNFRSTDFSHCKGVVGVAVQLCSRTEEISTSSVESLTPNLEMSFCRIKSFRSHGAERKNANDMAIAEKRIRKLLQQLAQLQTSQKSKDKRLGRDKSKTPIYPGAQRNHEHGLLCKIKDVQKNCISTQPYTFLDHQGEKQQDCDWPPAALYDKSRESPEAGSTLSSSAARRRLTPMTTGPKQSISSSQPTQLPTPPWDDESQQMMLTRDLPLSTKNRSMRHGVIKVACFYIRPVGFKNMSRDDHYIAVYLCERTACDLTRRIAEAVSVDPSKVAQTIWSNSKGLIVLVDDDVVANMIEGQHMHIEVKNTAVRSHSGRGSSLDSAGEVYGHEHEVSHGTRELLELKLLF